MRISIGDSWQRLSLAQQFMLATLAILVTSMIGVGWWVGRQIEAGVVHRTAATTALYVDSFISPQIQELAMQDTIAAEHMTALGQLMRDTPLGRQIVAFKLWNEQGRLLFSTGPTAAGLTFEVKPELAHAFGGDVVAGLSRLEDEENVLDRQQYSQLLEYYIPVRQAGTGRVIAVAEFYQSAEPLQGEILSVRTRSWLVVLGATVIMYLLLVGLVKRGSDTIKRQQADLAAKVSMLTGLLAENQELHERVRRAATRTTQLNERFLRRVSAELHDGPAQDLSLALLRLDEAAARISSNGEDCSKLLADRQLQAEDLETIQVSLSRALHEVRALSTGLRLPELDHLAPAEIVARVVRAHERRSSTKVALSVENLPEQAPMPVKITLYRLTQEALSNAFRHGGGIDQQVRISCDGQELRIEISDKGPGFDWSRVPEGGQHLGLIGMRERVESLGGVFKVETRPGQGTKITAVLSVHSVEEDLLSPARGGGT